MLLQRQAARTLAGYLPPLLAVVVLGLPCALRADAGGTIEGHVAFEPLQRIPVAMEYRTRTRAPILDPDPPRALVYLERKDGAYPHANDETVTAIDQQGYQFRPSMAIVRAGTSVSFPNKDDEFHSVFSYSSAKRFDLGRFRRDEPSPTVLLEQPGLIRVYCEIHKHMRGLLLVVETPWFTATDDAGRYAMHDVPPGEYRVHAFLPSEQLLETDVTVVAGETVRVDLAE
jgi:plastocyanin